MLNEQNWETYKNVEHGTVRRNAKDDQPSIQHVALKTKLEKRITTKNQKVNKKMGSFSIL